jgi:urate oxidase
MKIVSNRYGKKRVRVLKILRAEARHEVMELDVGCLLRGDFDTSYSAGDNRQVIPTDTIKNTVTVLAHQRLGPEIERFGLELGRHFLSQYPQVREIEVKIEVRRWLRHAVEGKPHPYVFIGGAGTPFSRVTCTRGGAEEVESGIGDWLILKSSGSGFAGYPKCDYTTLPETTDRILATRVRAAWTFGTPPADFNAANAGVLEAMLRVFALNYSPSVQATVYEMAGAALAACPAILRVSMALPNRHYLLANLTPFGLENPNVTFVPTDQPHGQIEAVIERD